MISIWSEETELPQFPKLQGDLRTSVLIIGGGIAGLLCAYFLQQAGVEYVLLEADTIAGGATRGTMGIVTSQHGLMYAQLCEKAGFERAKQYMEANELAISQYKKLAWKYQFDFEETDSYLYTRDDAEALEQELECLHLLTYPAEYLTSTMLPFPVKGAIRFPHQGQMDPYKLIKEITPELNIYEHSRVKEMTEYFAVTEEGTVTAEKIIVTTHFPMVDKKGHFHLKLKEQSARILAYRPTAALDGIYVKAGESGISFRKKGEYLLVSEWQDVQGIEQLLKEYEPNAKKCYEWTIQDCMSLDGMPYIGVYSKSTPDLYVATGFHRWGMTSSMVAAQILTDLVQEQENEYAALFSPSRNMLGKQLFSNLSTMTKNFFHADRTGKTHLGD